MSHTHGISNTQQAQITLNATERTAPVKNTVVSDPVSETTAAQSTASTATLSGAGTLLAASNTDDVRADKVASLKSAIDSGTYNVPAGDVADKLISSLLE